MWRFILTIILFIPIIDESKGLWSYTYPKKWLRRNLYCGGNRQSPIDLHFNMSYFDHRLKPLYLEDRYTAEKPNILNNGYTVQLNIRNMYVLKNVAPGSEDFKVEQVHFHWGHSNDDNNGSEHCLEGQPYPLEMHIVTYSDWYSDIREAMANARSLAVIGVFFELSDYANPLLQPLVDALAKVRRQGQNTTIYQEFNLKALISEEIMGHYYRYDGSLTTPPCYESVIWSVLVKPLKISFNQLHAFRYLHDDKAQLMQNTFRPLQSLGTRKLFRSFYSVNFEEEIRQRSLMQTNYAQHVSYNMKLITIIASLFMILR